MAETITNVTGTFTAGDDWSFTVTVKKDGATFAITGATVTTSLSQNGVVIVAAKSCTISDGANGIVTFSFTATESAAFMPGIATGDVKVVLSGVTTHHGPYTINVRSAIT